VIQTDLSRRLGLRYPVVCAPMFIISCKEMLLACAEAGILGSMPALNARTPESLRDDLTWVRERTDKPFAVNMTIAMADPERREADLKLLEELEVPVWITSYGNPEGMVQRAHASGALVFHDVITLRHARKAHAAGVDAIIAVSAGAGGHAGRITPFALWPWLKQELDTPIIAAGAISTGSQVAAALMLGADLAYMGTRFIASTECAASQAYKDLVVSAGPEDIVYTDQISGVNANFLKSTLPSERPDSPLPAKRWRDVWSAGQGVAQVHEVKPIESIVDDLVREFHDATARFR
jgi:nitronate monooxygenase